MLRLAPDLLRAAMPMPPHRSIPIAQSKQKPWGSSWAAISMLVCMHDARSAGRGRGAAATDHPTYKEGQAAPEFEVRPNVHTIQPP